ncbi:GNAT family N-acetyltransferase [Williamsia muralis]|uniref:GNAT family N-acetyltransferase n=1 Tax=Williamsia marianensis TaxID=85044 RepID=A0ABU4ENL2_WILMA|nr:GNAT family N-acetyltransferase [Williamsia muralis]MDV7132815.1 GNAT family N-acetyltransferase [Williamsia muralis]
MSLLITDNPAASAVAELRWLWARESDDAIGPWRDERGFNTAVRSWTDDPQRTVWVAHTTGQAVGMVCLTEYTRMPSPRTSGAGSWGYLGHLYVRSEYRGAGIGTQLVDCVLHNAEHRGYRKVILSPSELSIPLYSRHGFTRDNDVMVRRL